MPDTESIHTIDDLADWSPDHPALAVIGHPVKHSVSPAMHNAALDAMRADGQALQGWHYHKFDIPAERLGEALPLFFKAGFQGLNLTIPHKVEALRWITSVDPSVAAMGAVNTLIRDDRGYRGNNTDGFGLSRAIQVHLGLTLGERPVILLGAGGAARAAAVQCLRDGCPSLHIGNRSRERLNPLLDLLRPVAGQTPVHGFTFDNPPTDIPPDALIINATAAGLKAGEASPFSLEALSGDVRVYDMVYNPPVTPLMQDAQSRGFAHANGLSMLVWQGVRSLELWTGLPVPADIMTAAAEQALQPPLNHG